VHWGTSPGVYDNSVDVGLTATPAAPMHEVTDLPRGFTYHFAVTAYDYYGNESDYSNVGTKTIE
jgi:hypothetical protein